MKGKALMNKKVRWLKKLVQTGDIDSLVTGQLAHLHCKQGNHKALQHVLNTSTVTKEIAEILTPLENKESQKFVLIVKVHPY